MKWKVNTSNSGKLAEYKKYLGDVESFTRDLDEPDADMITIVRYKASQFSDSVLVDDVSLEIEDFQTGTLIRWQLHLLDQFIGKKAIFSCYIGLRNQDHIFIFKGETKGQLVSPKGQSFGFNNYFQPDGLITTFGELIPPDRSPRKIALDNLLHQKPFTVQPLLLTWKGPFQNKT